MPQRWNVKDERTKVRFPWIHRNGLRIDSIKYLFIFFYSGENLSCVVVFSLVYYSLMAAVVWFVILTYAWHMSFRALGTIQDRIDKKSAYFHLIAWCVPLVLTVAVMALGLVDGNSMTGICFVGYTDHAAKLFVLGPVLLAELIGGYFLCRGRYCFLSFVYLYRYMIILTFYTFFNAFCFNLNCEY